MAENSRFPKNVDGPFFVENGECIACRAPEHEAPDLMAFDEDAGHCYFEKQPSTPAEWERAIRAVCASCCAAVQYGGDDPAILRRISELEGKPLPEKREMFCLLDSAPWWRFW